MLGIRPTFRHHAIRGALLFLLILLTTGCSTMQPVHLPGDAEHLEAEGRDVRPVAVGLDVTVHLKSGDEVKGEVLEVDREKVVVGFPSNYGYQERTFCSVEIEWIETEVDTRTGRTLFVSFTTVFLVVTVVGVALFAGMDWSGMS